MQNLAAARMGHFGTWRDIPGHSWDILGQARSRSDIHMAGKPDRLKVDNARAATLGVARNARFARCTMGVEHAPRWPWAVHETHDLRGRTMDIEHAPRGHGHCPKRTICTMHDGRRERVPRPWALPETHDLHDARWTSSTGSGVRGRARFARCTMDAARGSRRPWALPETHDLHDARLTSGTRPGVRGRCPKRTICTNARWTPSARPGVRGR
jgi:hypothetical protein